VVSTAKRENLRACTQSQNNANCRKQSGTTSRYKGVSLDSGTGKWFVRIAINDKCKHLGAFTDEDEAARTYDRRAREAFGEFALTNENLGLLPAAELLVIPAA
jgi:hypothetical protein